MPKFINSRDNYFLACKILTLLACIPWPVILIPSIMSLAGDTRGMSPTGIFWVRLGWGLVLIYPVIYISVVLFAERIVAPISHAAGLSMAALPFLFSVYAIYCFFRT